MAKNYSRSVFLCSLLISSILFSSNSYASRLFDDSYLEDPALEISITGLECAVTQDAQSKFDSVKEKIQELQDKGQKVTLDDGIGRDNSKDYRKEPGLTFSQGSNVNALMSQLTRNIINSGQKSYVIDTETYLENPDLVSANGGNAPGRTVDFEVYSIGGNHYIRPRIIDYRGERPTIICGVSIRVEELLTLGSEALGAWIDNILFSSNSYASRLFDDSYLEDPALEISITGPECAVTQDAQSKFDSVKEKIQELQDKGQKVTLDDGIGRDNSKDYRKEPGLTFSQGSNVNALMSQLTRNIINSGLKSYVIDTETYLENPDLVSANGGNAPGRTVDFEVYSIGGNHYIRPRIIDYRGERPTIICGVSIRVEELLTLGSGALGAWIDNFTSQI